MYRCVLFGDAMRNGPDGRESVLSLSRLVRLQGVRRLYKDRLQRVASLALVVVAALASIATSPPREDISVRGQGTRVELSAEQPEATVSLEIQPSPEAVSAPRKTVTVRATPVWSGQGSAEETEEGEETAPLEGRVPAGGFTTTVTVPRAGEVLELAALDTDGGVLAVATGEWLTCEGEACAQMAAIRFRLLDPTAGTLVVNWELNATFHFGEGEVPPDAELDVVFGPADTEVTDVAGSGRVAMDIHRGRYDFRAVRIQIHAPGGVPSDADLRFEPLQIGLIAVLHETEEAHVLAERISIPLTPPQRCREGVCDWSLLVVGNLVDWQLAAPGGIDLEVGVAEVTPVELASEPVTGEAVRIGPGEQARLVATVEVDASVVDGPDFEGVGPLTAVEFTLNWDDPEPNLIVSRDSGFTAARLDSTVVATDQVSFDCDDVRCRAVTEIIIFFSQQQEGTVTWQAQAYVPFLVTNRVPGDAVVDLEVTR